MQRGAVCMYRLPFPVGVACGLSLFSRFLTFRKKPYTGHGHTPHKAFALPPIFDFRVACLFSSPYHTEHTEYTVHPHSYRERDGRLASVVLGLDPEV